MSVAYLSKDGIGDMYKNNIIVLVILILVVGFFASALALPLFGRSGLQLGLDLKGGVNLVYQVQFPDNTSASDKASIVERTVETIRNRIDQFGVADPLIQSVGDDRISIQLPGYTNIDEAKSLVEQTGFLEFREVQVKADGSTVVTLNDYLNGTQTVDSGTIIFAGTEGTPVAIAQKNADGNLEYVDATGKVLDPEQLKAGNNTGAYAWIPARGNDGTPLTGDLLSKATPQIMNSTTGTQAVVAIEWNSEGSVIFDQIAARLYGKSYPNGALGIFLDNSLLSAPVIQQPSYGGQGQIEGDFTQESAKHLADLLASGSLPMPLQRPPIYETVVSSTLGSNFIDMSVMAGVIAVAAIIVFMMASYKVSGVMASLSLLFYGVVVLAIFKLVPVTLNLAGIGGFVLSIGMAVDAHVLIFERMKEEIRNGRTYRSAIDNGFKRAWLSIRDTHVTTVISCLILFWVGGAVIGGEAVKGFALTLLIGVLLSMFTALVVAHTLLKCFIGTKVAKNTSLFSALSGGKDVRYSK